MSKHRPSLPAIRRVAAVALTGLACSLALVSPAHAAETVQVSKNGGVLSVKGTSGGEAITIDQPGGFGARITVTINGGVNATAGAGCIQLSSRKVECDETFQIGVAAGAGNDDVLVNSQTRAILFGNLGNDNMFGGSGNDELRGADGTDRLDGGAGTDSANGGNGTDTCTAETEAACES
jgi:Ca2+-binding RTX toxin-like protein